MATNALSHGRVGHRLREIVARARSQRRDRDRFATVLSDEHHRYPVICQTETFDRSEGLAFLSLPESDEDERRIQIGVAIT